MLENDAVEAEKPETTEEEKLLIADNDESEEVAPEALEPEKAENDTKPAEPVVEKKRTDKRKPKRRVSAAMRQITAWFAACGRCSFFLTGYQLICDDDVFDTAVSDRSKKWLTLPWSHEAARLVHKTYGSRVDINCYHYEGQCKECHRRFTYQAAIEEDKTDTFRIELKP